MNSLQIYWTFSLQLKVNQNLKNLKHKLNVSFLTLMCLTFMMKWKSVMETCEMMRTKGHDQGKYIEIFLRQDIWIQVQNIRVYELEETG